MNTSSLTPDFVGRSCCTAANREDESAVGAVAKEKNVIHCFHVVLQGVNGHKCSQLFVCLRCLIVITGPRHHRHTPHLAPDTRWSCCALCHITLRRNWTGCLIVHVHMCHQMQAQEETHIHAHVCTCEPKQCIGSIWLPAHCFGVLILSNILLDKSPPGVNPDFNQCLWTNRIWI